MTRSVSEAKRNEEHSAAIGRNQTSDQLGPNELRSQRIVITGLFVGSLILTALTRRAGAVRPLIPGRKLTLHQGANAQWHSL